MGVANKGIGIRHRETVTNFTDLLIPQGQFRYGR